ncbi:MAG: NTP transferase domain-containing protein [Candidatus Baltobacteraceae bacterium]
MHSSGELVAAITAGGRVDGRLAERMGTTIKALAPLGGRRLIDAALGAARAAGAVRIAVVGGEDVRAYCGERIDVALDESESGEENLHQALAFAGERALLLLTSDLPFVEGDGVRRFLDATRDCDLAMPLANACDYAAKFPNAPSHMVTLAGERVANGSGFYFGPGVAPRVIEIATKLFAARKSLFRMAALVGPVLLGRFVARRLRIVHLENRAQRLFNLRARAIRDASPGLCYDVDTLEDYEYARTRLDAD